MIFSELLGKIPEIQHGFGTRDAVLPTDPPPWRCKQVHSDQLIDLDAYTDLPSTETIEADAVYTGVRGQPIGIQTADCVPLLLSAPDVGVIAAIHAGWRGTVTGIVSKVVNQLCAEKGADVGKMVVSIGPCISRRHYEVGTEVATQFDSLFLTSKGGDKYLLDLAAANQEALVEVGVLKENIDIIEQCTFECEDHFYSYRRDGGKSGRNISWIMLT